MASRSKGVSSNSTECRTGEYDASGDPKVVWQEKVIESGKSLDEVEVCSKAEYDAALEDEGKRVEMVVETGKSVTADSYDAAVGEKEQWVERVVESGKTVRKK
jgi:hypothetical protein